jgi:hypothetical protein
MNWQYPQNYDEVSKNEEEEEELNQIEIVFQELIFIKDSTKVDHEFVESNIFKEKKIL